jgi:predicted permease
MGLPLLAGVLGEDALLYGVISMLVFFIFQWTHGVVTMGGKFSLRSTFLNPGIIAVLVGVLFFAVGVRLPSPVYNAMDFMGDLNTPLAMVIIGAQMARSDILGVLKKPKLYLTAAIKLLFVPAITCVLILPLHLEPLSYCACVVLSACPTAGVTAMFAQMFHRDEETAAQMVTLSTLLSIVTLPIFAVLARQIAGF